MMAVRAYFDGKVIVPRQSVDLPAGQDLVLTIEPVQEPAGAATPDLFAPLSFQIEPKVSRRIADGPRFNIENS